MKAQGFLLAFALVLLAGCRSRDESGSDAAPTVPAPDLPALETHADSVAMRVYDAFGGPQAWAALPYLRFNFGFGRDGERQVRAKHLWDRMSGDYRVEWPGGADSTYVVLFNVNTREGQAYLNGAALDTAANSQALEQAYQRFINDTYWLMAPVKLLDPGVRRTYMPDSSGAGTDVLMLTFEGVGLTPGDRYWFYVDKGSGRVERWRFLLQSGREDAFDWTGYETFETAAGPVVFATRKEQVNGAGTLYTDAVEVPAEVDPEMFTDPRPRLGGTWSTS